VNSTVKLESESQLNKMPVFHTKTIESILEPVANQVRLSVFKNSRNILFFNYILINIVFLKIHCQM